MENVKKIRMLAVIVALFAAALSFSSCDMPDYQLSFYVIDSTSVGNYAQVNYVIQNIGYERLKNVQVKIEVEGTLGWYSGWTSGVDLSVDQSVTSSLSIYCPGHIAGNAVITASGWDKE